MSPVGLRHGVPCSRCPESRPGQQPHDAVTFGMCGLCWLGATERQRRDARFDNGEGSDIERSRWKHERFDEYCTARQIQRDGERFAAQPTNAIPVDAIRRGLALDDEPEQQWGETDVAA